MVLEAGLTEVYYVVVALFQLSLAALVLATGRVGPLRGGVGLVLGFAGIQAAAFASGGGLDPAWFEPVNRPFDGVIVWTAAFLLSRFPTPAGGQRGARIGLVAWVAIVLGLLPAIAVTRLVAPDALAGRLSDLPHDLAFPVAGALLAVHVVPRVVELEPGPLRRQTVLAAGGLAMAAVYRAGTRVPLWLGDPGALGRLLVNVTTGAHLATLFFVLVALARLARAGWRAREPEVLGLLGLLVLGLLLGARRQVFDSAVVEELATQVLRPVLLGLAMLRYDLFRVPEGVRRVAVPATGIALGVVLFLLFSVLLSPEGLEAASLSPVSAVLSVAVLAGVVLAGRRWLAGAGTQAGDREGDEDRLDRYRLALQRARQGAAPEGGRLPELRERLEIRPAEHALMAQALDEQGLVPTGALRPAEPGDVVAGRFEVDRVLGAGGAGRALGAWDLEAERTVVLKEVLRPWEADADARRAALEREAATAREVEASALARVHGLVREGARWYLVREHVPGRTLDEVVDEEGALPPERVREVVRAVAEGLSALHGADLLHLDVKPSNVVLADDGRAVLVDQGTARRAPGAGGGATHHTATLDGAQARGTLAWMAPEQVLEETVTPRTDVFALGALAYYLATGRHHVDVEGSPFEVEDAIVHGVPPADAPDELDEGIRAALTRDPGERPPSVDALLERLGAREGDG